MRNDRSASEPGESSVGVRQSAWTRFWFTPTVAGRYEALCAQLCGVGHPNMRGFVVVEDEASFNAWLAAQPTFAKTQVKAPAVPPAEGAAGAGALVEQGRSLAESKGCVACHGANGTGGRAPELKSKDGPSVATWERGRILPVRAPFATIVWDYINRGMPLGREGSLKPDEVYALTAFLLSLNEVIPEDFVLDQQSLPKVKMPIGEDYASLPDWKPKTRRLKGYPY